MKFIKNYASALVWLGVVTGLSVMPGISIPKFDLLSPDKLAHAFIYFVLSVLILQCYRKSEKKNQSSAVSWWVFFFSCGYGILMEWVQGAFLAGRFCELDDMIANVVGAVCGVLFFNYLKKREWMFS